MIDRQKTLLRIISRDYNLYLMVIPGLLWLVIFRYIPIYGVIIAFKDYSIFRGVFDSPWIGFRYFKQFFASPYCWRVIRNTLLLNVFNIIFAFPAPIVLALLINEVKNQGFKRLTQSISYLPHFISTVIIVGMLYNFASSDGIFNGIVFSIFQKRINFFLRPFWFRPLYIGSGIWQNIGWTSIIYLAAISQVDVQMYEAAVIDGAGRFRKMFHITLPSIEPTIKILFLLNIGYMLTIGFEKVYLMYNPAIYKTADVISTYVYRWGIQDGSFSFAAAVGLFSSLVSLVLLIIANFIAKKFGDTSLW